jgi:hypothetical protein
VKKAPPRVYAQTIIRIRMPGHFIVQVGAEWVFVSVLIDWLFFDDCILSVICSAAFMSVVIVVLVNYYTCVVCVMLLFRRVLSGPKSLCIVLLTG